jgi:hypothetical protein
MKNAKATDSGSSMLAGSGLAGQALNVPFGYLFGNISRYSRLFLACGALLDLSFWQICR